MRIKSPDFPKSGLAGRVRSNPAAAAAVMLGCAFLASGDTPAAAARGTLAASALTTSASSKATEAASDGGGSLEAAASKAGAMGRKVAMSLIGLALAVAAVVLAFRRDFRKVAGVLVVGLLAIVLATPVGMSVLQDTARSLFGSS